MRFVTFVLGFALLGLVSLQPSAFSQETNQEATKRKVTAKVPPKYPPLARQLKLSGKVRVVQTAMSRVRAYLEATRYWQMLL
jgi:hypothetical protein